MIIQYDGTEYSGWQIQNNADTVQKQITGAINMITKENINLIGSGRTDSGVHALGQVANFRTGLDLDIYKIKHSINAVLPRDISVISIESAEENFHARFDAKKRVYIYLFSKHKSPFWGKYSYFYHGDLNCSRLNRLSEFFIGKKDYTSFSRKNSETKNKVCKVYSAFWKETRGLVVFKIEADRFLHGMVRTVIGTLLESVKAGYDEKILGKIFAANERGKAGEAVPPNGLFLFKVKY